jgi:hypothetical protein
MDEATIRDLVVRLSRPHPSGGKVIERAAILAAGAGSGDVLDWIVRRAGRGETAGIRRAGGLHGDRLAGDGRTDGPPLRYILPAGALDSPARETESDDIADEADVPR